jgi:predicted dithiol-disulfide oxidoreductase (DUF899 family)
MATQRTRKRAGAAKATPRRATKALKPHPKRATAAKAKPPRATKTAELHDKRFPGESAAYRRARNKLLESEVELRRAMEAVAAQRRKLPAGGVVAKDYIFEEAVDGDRAREVRLSELFSPGKDTLVIYNFMFGPDDEAACPSCTSMLDSLDGAATHLSQRINLAVVAKSPLPRILAHARRRGWRHLRLMSSAGNTYKRDYFGESPDGDQWPVLNVFKREGGKLRHFWSSELFFAPSDKGQDMRHVDFIWPIWNVFDVTPEGRGAGHLGVDFPSLSYPD